MEEEKILENITKSISERLKVPIIFTYISVLIVYNWDILFYLFFQENSAFERIEYIKNNYSEIYYQRIFICLGIAILLITIFTILNTLINVCLKWFYRKDKETSSEIDNYEKINSLTEQLSNAIDNIKSLNSQLEKLKNINENLNSKSLNIKIEDISKKDYENVLQYLNSRENKEKFIYTFKEFINALKKDITTDRDDLYNIATYQHEMILLIRYLEQIKLLKVVNRYSQSKSNYANEFDLSKSILDFLKMD